MKTQERLVCPQRYIGGCRITKRHTGKKHQFKNTAAVKGPPKGYSTEETEMYLRVLFTVD